MLSEHNDDNERNLPGTLQPVRGAFIVRVAMRPMTSVLNPVIKLLAGRRAFLGRPVPPKL